MKNFIFIFALIISYSSYSQPGFVDQNFGNSGLNGSMYSSLNNGYYSVARQQDGKLVVAGYITFASFLERILIFRYKEDGTFDSTFSSDGIIIDSIGQFDCVAYSVLVQTDNKILIIGSFKNPLQRDVFIKRYDSTGVVDSSFGINGVVTLDLRSNSDDVAFAGVLQPDGKILITGTSKLFSYEDIMLLRYNSNGTPDTTFGFVGMVISDITPYDDQVNSIVLQQNGKILVSGIIVGSDVDALIVRYKSDGIVDSSFNTTGIFRFDNLNNDDYFYSVTVQPDGKILAAGKTFASGEDQLIVRLDSTGGYDQTFNMSGILIKDFLGIYNQVNNLFIQTDGKIVSVGYDNSINIDIALSRYEEDGTLDMTFGHSGHILHSIFAGDDIPISACLQPDNKIVVTGTFENGLFENAFIARYTNDSTVLGVQLLKETNLINIYPQPVANLLHISCSEKINQIAIHDLYGQLIFDDVQNDQSIDVSLIASGVYILTLQLSDYRINTLKFVKQ